MAEYYPLLAKAVAGLADSTPDTRRAVYERARKALLGQLRKLEPPVPEAAVEREGQALDEAIEKLEAEFAAQAEADAAAAEAAETEAAKAEADTAADATTAVPPSAVAASDEKLSPPAGLVMPQPVQVEAETTKAEPPKLASEPPKFEPPKPEPAKPQGLQTRLPKPEPLKPASKPKTADGTPVLELSGKDPDEDAGSASDETPVFPKVRREPQRPIAPQAPVAKPNRMGLWIVMGVIAVIVGGVAVAAWKLRDRPETLASLKTITAQQPAESSGKISGRADETAEEKPAADTAKPAAGAQTAQQQAVQNAQQTVPVSYRAALLIQAPEEQNKVKTYFGTVVWRLDNVSNGPGETVSTALRATIDIPEDKFQATLTLQKNVDASLPATHTMMINFTIQPGAPTGASIKQIGVPQMRREDSANGEPLAGMTVPIMENSFLIGLMQGSSDQNIEMLRTRQWIDIPIQFADNRIAKLTFEKGVSGQGAIDDALASWGP